MSAVFGIFNRTKKVLNTTSFQTLNNTLSYWEADETGSWVNDSVSLGHRMLWNTPESKLEKLPHVTHIDNQTFVITIDARLDNRDALQEELKLLHIPLDELTDSMIVLTAYEKWGETCAKHLLGDFVFVIWDEDKEQLFCVRDQIGIKPFYYYLDDDLFIFSNDIRGLTTLKKAQKYNDTSIAMFLSADLGFYNERDTFFKEIHKLPAATSLIVTKSKVLESIYWDIDNISKVHYDSFDAYVLKLRELLLDAVKVRVRATYPVASHLSGGIDSSAIAVLAARELKQRDTSLYSFNWVATPEGEHDPDYIEWGYATQLAKKEGITQIPIKMNADYLAHLYDTINVTTDDGSYFFEEYLVRDEAEKYGVRTILSGWGGDDLISYDGYAYLSGLLRQGKVLKALKDIYYFYDYKNIKYRYLRTLKKAIKELVYPYFYKHMSGLYTEEDSKQNTLDFTHEEFGKFARTLSFDKLEFHAGAHNEQKALFKSGHIVQRIEAWAASAHGKKMEYVYPLLDRRIVEFALGVPEDLYRWREGHERFFFRSAISDFLPKHIAWESKNGEPLHGDAWVQLWFDGLFLWMKNNEKMGDSRNYYIDRSKIIKRIKVYFENKENQIEDDIGNSRIVSSIFLLNLKNEDYNSNKKNG